ncbi:WS/DGAT domain-containing protein [Mycobacterium sp. CVI_P3]|uniref:WS/DGAT domain-containing protein n=1 Tax=Mycobacterium pinniadriaticum TaxID=2994102 RepID=A0ABT3SLN5_9MYCO|nr:WS/DGAT domain-containing protein [Mycobacterium pinniadriaticum]MCX2933835.1 WS/DGAT domain-containing protein [Mycobacterium pinniadriaticum]MCX2940257.1 WS/DGAT domain-containing protein [Mycobacterium pinniadriaticum]
MTAVDAQMLWMSAVIPNDQFLLYAFAGSPGDVDGAVAELRSRAQACDELRLRVADDGWWRYPRWGRAEVGSGQFVVHHTEGMDWQGCLRAIVELGGEQLDLYRMAWRAHVFPRVLGVPGRTGDGSVIVVQMGHAFADNNRGAALCGALLGRDRPVPIPVAARRGFLPALGFSAALAHRMLVRDTEAGLVPGPPAGCPVRSINRRPNGTPAVRTLTLHRDRLAGPTVTIASLVAIGEAMAGYLAGHGEEPSRLGAEVPMACMLNPAGHNNFRNVGIALHPDVGPARRAELIAAELSAQRRRGRHPAMRASAAASAAIPAPLLRWGVRHFDPDARSETVTGNTVVSSVNRGPADLSFGGFPVALTAGYPALSPMMSLTHGVHGIGDTIAISVHADSDNVDIDDYWDRLQAALPG